MLMFTQMNVKLSNKLAVLSICAFPWSSTIHNSIIAIKIWWAESWKGGKTSSNQMKRIKHHTMQYFHIPSFSQFQLILLSVFYSHNHLFDTKVHFQCNSSLQFCQSGENFEKKPDEFKHIIQGRVPEIIVHLYISIQMYYQEEVM